MVTACFLGLVVLMNEIMHGKLLSWGMVHNQCPARKSQSWLWWAWKRGEQNRGAFLATLSSLSLPRAHFWWWRRCFSQREIRHLTGWEWSRKRRPTPKSSWNFELPLLFSFGPGWNLFPEMPLWPLPPALQGAHPVPVSLAIDRRLVAIVPPLTQSWRVSGLSSVGVFQFPALGLERQRGEQPGLLQKNAPPQAPAGIQSHA